MSHGARPGEAEDLRAPDDRDHLCPSIFHVPLCDRNDDHHAFRPLRPGGRDLVRAFCWATTCPSPSGWGSSLLGIAVETVSVMLTYLDEVYERRKKEQKITSLEDLYHAVGKGVTGIRPILMTVTANIFGLLPVMWEHGDRGGCDEEDKPASLMGGLTSSMILTLVVLPAVYVIWKGDWGMRRK